MSTAAANRQRTRTVRAHMSTDGRYVVTGPVAIAAETRDVRRVASGGPTILFAREDLERWLTTYRARYDQEGYLPPLHAGHHGGGPVETIGAVEPVSVEARYRLDDHDRQRPQWVLYARLHVLARHWPRVASGELAYRSIEAIGGVLTSLALLSHEPPYHMLERVRFELDETARVAYSRALEVAMPDMPPKAETEDEDEDENKPEPAVMAAETDQTAIPGWAADLMRRLEALEARSKEPAPIVVEQAARLSRLEGEFVGFAAQLGAREAESKRDALARSLRESGHGEQVVSDFLARYAREATSAEAYAAGVLAAGPVRTAVKPSLAPLGAQEQAAPQDPPEVLAYARHGKEALRDARVLHEEWKRWGSRAGVALETHLRANMEVLS